MITFLWNLLLAFIWATATREFSLANVVIGFVLGYIILSFSRPVMGDSPYYAKVRQATTLFFFVLWQLTKANLRLALEVVSPNARRRSGIIAIPLDTQSDIGIALLAGLISITPGTLALDVDEERRYLYIHAMFVGSDEDLRQEIKHGLERRVAELLG